MGRPPQGGNPYRAKPSPGTVRGGEMQNHMSMCLNGSCDIPTSVVGGAALGDPRATPHV